MWMHQGMQGTVQMQEGRQDNLKIVIFGFLGPENIGIDTKIQFLSILLADIGDNQNLHVGHFEKCLPHPAQVKSSWGHLLK